MTITAAPEPTVFDDESVGFEFSSDNEGATFVSRFDSDAFGPARAGRRIPLSPEWHIQIDSLSRRASSAPRRSTCSGRQLPTSDERRASCVRSGCPVAQALLHEERFRVSFVMIGAGPTAIAVFVGDERKRSSPTFQNLYTCTLRKKKEPLTWRIRK